MHSRRVLKNLATLCLGVMLFAQAAIALAACDLLLYSRQNALAAIGQEAASAPCHEHKGNVNLCVAHCQVEDLSLDKPQVNVHALVVPPALALRATHAPQGNLNAAMRIPGAWAAPPARILFQSLLI